MANIVIKDLPENIDLDRAAMRVITGGVRRRSYAPLPAQTILRSASIVDYLPGVRRTPPAKKSNPAE